MESQMVRHTYEQDPYKAQDQQLVAPMEGEEEQHHEKKSVLKKVKAKAKKIKDTITKHGHGHDHDHDHHEHIPDDHDLNEEDEDDESIEDPEIHGAPMYESTTVTMGSTPANTPVPSFTDRGVSDTSKETSQTFVLGKELTKKVNLDTPRGLERDPHAPSAELEGHSPANYQTKVTDPTGKGANEIGATQILKSFNKMNLGDSNLPSPTGSHDRSSPDPLPRGQDDTAKPASYTDKVSAATSAIAGKAALAKNAVVWKLGYGGNDKPDSSSFSGSHDHFSPEPNAANPTGYTDKVSSVTSAIADKAASAKDTVVSKLGYGDNAKPESHNQFSSEPLPRNDATAVKPTSYTDKVSSVTSVISGKAVSAKDAVVSKLGYGSRSENSNPPSGTAPDKQDKGVSVKEYLVEKLRPGDDDRAMSEAIGDALHRREPTVGVNTASGEGPVLGKVTQSEAVTRHLGEDRGTEREAEKGGSEGNGYVSKVKGTVGSWLGFGNTTGLDPSKASQENVHGKTVD